MGNSVCLWFTDLLVLRFFYYINKWKIIGILAYNSLFFPNIFWKLKFWSYERNVLRKNQSENIKWNFKVLTKQNTIVLEEISETELIIMI